MTIPGQLSGGVTGGNPDAELVRRMRKLEQDVADLRTARIIQSLSSSALRPAVVNIDRDGLNLPLIDASEPQLEVATGYIDVPEGFTRALNIIVGSVGATGPSDYSGYVLSQAAISKRVDALDASNLQKQATSVYCAPGAGTSSYCFYANIIDGLQPGIDQIQFSVFGCTSSPNFRAVNGSGNGHLAGQSIFLR